VADKEEVEPTEQSTGAPGRAGSESSGSSLTGSSLSGSSLAGSSHSGSTLSDSSLSGSSDQNGSAREPDVEPDQPLNIDGDGSRDAEGEGDLVTIGAPRRRSTKGTAAPGSVVKASRGPKGRPTPSRRGDVAKKERTGPIKFVRESIGELRKVVYPTGQQVIQYFVVVLVFVLFVIAYVSLLDLALGAALFKIFS
jgi:preprotein translocase subunit SecE